MRTQHASHWHRHPAVRTGAQLTRGERAADRMRNTMGSWGFVFGALVFLAGWMLGNSSNGFDPYPFILLNLLLSCLAAMQGAILLIAAKREDQISSELAVHDYETNVHADQLVNAIHTLTSEIHASVCGKSSPATTNDARPGRSLTLARGRPGDPPARDLGGNLDRTANARWPSPAGADT